MHPTSAETTSFMAASVMQILTPALPIARTFRSQQLSLTVSAART